MSQIKSKAESLYNKLKASREKLVKQYEAAGTIRYDVATGICPPNAAGVPNTTAPTRREKSVTQYDEVGKNPITRTVLDFTAISVANIADGISSGTMKDAFAKRATGKVVELYANDSCLRYGGILLWEVPCMLKIMDDINSLHNGVFPLFDTNTPGARGVVHSLTDKVEAERLAHRGFFKPVHYRGDADWMKNPVSLWSQTDLSRQSIFLFGVNSLIRLWGKDQVIDLNGKTVDVHSRPNLVAAFAVIIDFSDSHFAALSTKGSVNTHVFSSTGKGRLGRNNHFALRGHFVKKLLVEGLQFGNKKFQNKGSYFGSAIFNDSSEVVMRDCHQEQLIKHAPRSSLGLSWQADITISDSLFAKFELSSTFNAAGANANYPWMTWPDKVLADADTYGNNKTSPFPKIKTGAELETAGVTAGQGATVRNLLLAAMDAVRASQKHNDDVYIQVNIGHGRNFVPLTNGTLLERAEQAPRTTNLVVAQPVNNAEDRHMYPDSVAYGFRAGSTDEGVGNLSSTRGGTAQEVYLMDCSFESQSMSMMEAVSMMSPSFGLFKTFNGQALRPFGYSNSRNPVAGIAASSMHISQASLQQLFGSTKFVASSPFADSDLDTAAMAYANTDQTGYTNTYADAKAVNGLYKGHDILESSLATLTAIGRLAKHFTAAGPAAVLSGLNNSNMDIGILAWRYSMMEALGASTANHIGLKGGYAGDLTDRVKAPTNAINDGEIYPWFKSKARSNDITYGVKRISGTFNGGAAVTYTFETTNRFIDFKAADAITLTDGVTPVSTTVVAMVVNTAREHQRQFTISSTADLSTTTYNSATVTVGTRIDGTQANTIDISKDADFFAALALDSVNFLRSTLSAGYLACKLPEPSNNLYKFKFELVDASNEFGGVKAKLVTAVSEAAVTYGDCVTLLGFDALGLNKMASATPVEYTFVENLDGQNHVHKGQFGIRFDQITDCAAIRCRVKDFENGGFVPEVRLIANKTTAEAVGITDPQRPGSHVNDAYGISVNGVTNCYIEDFEASGIETLGDIYGINVQGGSKNVEIDSVVISNIHAGQIYAGEAASDSFSLSGKVGRHYNVGPQKAIGVRIASSVKDAKVNNVVGTNISSAAPECAKTIVNETL